MFTNCVGKELPEQPKKHFIIAKAQKNSICCVPHLVPDHICRISSKEWHTSNGKKIHRLSIKDLILMIHRVQEGPKISFFAIDWKSPIFFLQALTFPSLLLAVMALALVALGPGGLVLTPPRPASPTGTHHTSPKQPHSRHLHPHTHPARPWQEITHMLGPASYLV